MFADCRLLNGAGWNFTDKPRITHSVGTRVILTRAGLRECGKIEKLDVSCRKGVKDSVISPFLACLGAM